MIKDSYLKCIRYNLEWKPDCVDIVADGILPKKSFDLDTIVSVEFDLLNELIDEDTNSALGEAL